MACIVVVVVVVDSNESNLTQKTFEKNIKKKNLKKKLKKLWSVRRSIGQSINVVNPEKKIVVVVVVFVVVVVVIDSNESNWCKKRFKKI